MKSYSAKDIVKIYSELKDLTPDVNEWTEYALQNSKPRLIRLNQLIALKKAFKIDCSWIEFEQGKFIKHIPIDSYTHLKENIIKFKNTRSWNNQNFDNLYYSDVIKTYRLFIEFIAVELKLRNLISSYSMTYSLGQRYGFEKTKGYFISNNNKKIESMMEDLSLIIDPTQTLFSETELISSFNFPKENLVEIDLESW